MMRSLTPISIVALAGAFGLAMVASAGASADSVSDFYKGKRVTLIVGSSPGGGYDAYARTTARHMGAHIPGHPDIIVKNNPGAGSVVAANRIYNVLPQDGTIIGAIQRTVPFNQIMGFKGPNYDPVKFQWLGSMTNEAGVIAVTDKAKAKTIEDTFKYKTIMGSTGPTDSEIYPALMNNTLGTKFTIVQGYPGSAEIHLALKRGEVEGYSQSWSSFKNEAGPKFLKNHVRVLVQLSLKPLAEMSKMGVPMIMDYVDKQHVLPQYSVDEVKTWWRLMLTSKAMGRPYTVGPKVPADRVKALRKAFMDTANDPAFVKDAKKQGREVSPISGEEVQQMVARPRRGAESHRHEGQGPDQVQGSEKDGDDRDGQEHRQGDQDQERRPAHLHRLQGQDREGQGVGQPHQGHRQRQEGQAQGGQDRHDLHLHLSEPGLGGQAGRLQEVACYRSCSGSGRSRSRGSGRPVTGMATRHERMAP